MAWENADPTEEDEEQTLQALAAAAREQTNRKAAAPLVPLQVSFSQETKEEQNPQGQEQQPSSDTIK